MKTKNKTKQNKTNKKKKHTHTHTSKQTFETRQDASNTKCHVA